MNDAAGGAAPPAALVIDATGMSCGWLESKLADAMSRIESGEILEIHSDQLSARDGVRSWSWLTGHPLLAIIQQDAHRTRFLLQKK